MLAIGTVVLLLGTAPWVHSAEVPKPAPVPPSPFLPVIYKFADTLLDRGRDTHGPLKTPLLLSALDRTALAPLTNRPPPPSGVRETDRAGKPGGPLTGANPQHDENLLRLLYTLSELSSRPKYREAADDALKWFLTQAASTNTHLLPWGEHLAWDTLTDSPTISGPSDAGTHEFFRPWLLWNRCFDVAPGPSLQFAEGLWGHQIANPDTGAFDRHAGFVRHQVAEEHDFPRHAGFFIRTWAEAYASTRQDSFLKRIAVLLDRFEAKRHPKSGLIPAWTGYSNAWMASSLSLAIDCDGASRLLPEPLSSRLRDFAEREDELFCSLRHDLGGHGGFTVDVSVADAKPTSEPTALWEARYGAHTTAQVGMMCVSRYENSSRTDYRDLIEAAAGAYLSCPLPETVDVWPGTVGQAISLLVSAWRSTARIEFLDRARGLAQFALDRFFDGSPLPRASLRSAHYETITGSDTLALALVELHLHILHITAVRCPPNTADR